MMFVYSPPLAWRGSALIVAALLVTLLVGWLQLSTQRRITLLRGRTSGLVLQLLSSIAKLRVAGAEVRAFAIWARYFGEQRQQQFRSRVVRNLYGTLMVVLADHRVDGDLFRPQPGCCRPAWMPRHAARRHRCSSRPVSSSRFSRRSRLPQRDAVDGRKPAHCCRDHSAV
ncbi:MAG: hypothetical protein U5K74_01115 [Gemmatimonadaceae bacterium]|nr:hypothetical protein [Gemmatimonadaceae bacterium]